MAQEEPNRFVEWFHLLRGQIPVIRQHLKDWVEAVREEPVLIWQTVAVRYAAYGLGAVVLLWGAYQVAGTFAPPATATPQAKTADFHVVCTNPDCRHHFVIHREFGYRKFPVECPKCHKRTGAQARRCNSATCRGRWVPLERKDDKLYCPVCGAQFE